LLSEVRSNLVDIKNLCEGKIVASNLIKNLSLELHADQVPKNWLKFNVYALNVNEWVLDFKKRLE